MDDLDRKILDIIQTNFPISKHPYQVLGEAVGLNAEDAYQRVQNLQKQGIIRRIGANFQSSKLGYVSTLCAAKVPEDKIDAFVSLVNARPETTHNYLREHEYNIWFTLISPSKEHEKNILQEISQKSGIEILNLPATKLFKIRVDFAMQE